MTTVQDGAPVVPMTGSVFSPFEVRDLEEQGRTLTRLAGLAVPYNRPADIGPFSEEFTPGAFKTSIQGGARHLPLLLFHNDRGWPIGRSEEWHDRSDGLHGVWSLDHDPDAQRAARMARDGMLSYLSIRFQQDGDRYRFDNSRSKPHFIRQSARLIETSLTTTPVYIDSTVSWVRSTDPDRQPPALKEWTDYLDQIRLGPQTRAADPKKPYGDVTYADPGYQKDKKKRYPIDTEAHCRAAWSYINQAENAAKYTSEQLAHIKGRIKAAGRRFSIKFEEGS